MWAKIVALRKESVDRNFCVVCVIVDNNVALRKESVDRNGGGLSACARGCRSLSARRAWIEIFTPAIVQHSGLSLSARRAWIEMHKSIASSQMP